MRKMIIPGFLLLAAGILSFLFLPQFTGKKDDSTIRHFSPSEETNLDLEFDYPAAWGSPVQPHANVIIFYEPGESTPAPRTNREREDPYELSSLSVNVFPFERMEDRLDPFLNPNRKIVEVIKSEQTRIDGYPAWIIVRKGKRDSRFSIETVILTQLPDRYYLIRVSMPEHKVGGEFDQGASLVLETLNFK